MHWTVKNKDFYKFIRESSFDEFAADFMKSEKKDEKKEIQEKAQAAADNITDKLEKVESDKDVYFI